MPNNTKVTYDKMAYWVPVPWDNHEGRVTLAGDAAHPMTPRKSFIVKQKNSIANIFRPWSGPEPRNL
jgi:hypothetical protein